MEILIILISSFASIIFGHFLGKHHEMTVENKTKWVDL